MKAKLYPIPAKQALTQGKEPIKEVEILSTSIGVNNKVVVQFEDGILEAVPVDYLQVAIVKPQPVKKAIPTGNKKSS